MKKITSRCMGWNNPSNIKPPRPKQILNSRYRSRKLQSTARL
jgi:hypothetical protein